MKTAIVDLSALYWRNWHVSENDEMSSARRRTLGFVRSLYGEFDDVFVALDRPPYKRKEIYPDYKANRPERNQAAVAELDATVEAILKDGWSVAYCDGWEADDVIATLVAQLPEGTDLTVFAVDKDLLQCCDITDPCDRNKVKTAQNTLGILPEKVVDYLALVGDISDNIPGVKGVGAKTAVALLSAFDDISGIYKAAIDTPDKFKPATVENLNDAASIIAKTQEIIRLNSSLDLTIEKREPKNEPVDAEFTEDSKEKESSESESGEVRHIVKHSEITYERSLEPVGLREAYKVAQSFFESRLYSQFPNPDAIFVTMLRGRSLGIDATTALDSIHLIKDKPTMSAQLMSAIVQVSPVCEYLYCEDSDDESCTWVTKRANNPKEQRKRYHISDAKKLNLTSRDNWKKQPAIMLQWRCVSALCRMVYPDVIKGFYAREEFE